MTIDEIIRQILEGQQFGVQNQPTMGSQMQPLQNPMAMQAQIDPMAQTQQPAQPQNLLGMIGQQAGLPDYQQQLTDWKDEQKQALAQSMGLEAEDGKSSILKMLMKGMLGGF